MRQHRGIAGVDHLFARHALQDDDGNPQREPTQACR